METLLSLCFEKMFFTFCFSYFKREICQTTLMRRKNLSNNRISKSEDRNISWRLKDPSYLKMSVKYSIFVMRITERREAK